MKVKLIRKFANAIDGIDLSRVRVGDTFDLKSHQAVLLIREGWAEPFEEQSAKKSEQKNG